MTIKKHEIITVTSAIDARSISAAIDEVPSGADLTDVEIDLSFGVHIATLTFRREVSDE